MSDLLKYYRLTDDLGTDYYRGDGNELERLEHGAGWVESFLTLSEIKWYITNPLGFEVTFEEISSAEVPA